MIFQLINITNDHIWNVILFYFDRKMSSPPVDPRRPEKVRSLKSSANGQTEDFLPDYFNILGMIFSMCGLMMKLKWCGR